jgi:uncharacterized membrane protein YidH (DUF202 family)
VLHDRDPGLQAERTALAWGRSALALLANALLIMRAGLTSHHHEVLLLGAMLLVAAIGAALYGWLREREFAQISRPESAPPIFLALLAFVSFLACLVAIRVVGTSL